MDECIKVNNLTKWYEKKIAVDNLSFYVKKGEIFGMLGHNGAGKNTTIDCILGLTGMDQGEATILGMNAKKDRNALFERAGVQLQQSQYQNNIKVKELCEEISVLYKSSHDYHDLLKQFSLNSFIDSRVEKLSGGEKQKLSILLALIPDPEVIFLDELTTGLDIVAR